MIGNKLCGYLGGTGIRDEPLVPSFVDSTRPKLFLKFHTNSWKSYRGYQIRVERGKVLLV